MMTSENADSRSTYPPLFGNSFSFKLEDKKGCVHRFNSGMLVISIKGVQIPEVLVVFNHKLPGKKAQA
jgi:hypothetical protein